MMLFSITGTKEVFSFIASSGIRLLCFFVNKVSSLQQSISEKNSKTQGKEEDRSVERKKKKKRQTCADRHEIQRRSKKEDGCR